MKSLRVVAALALLFAATARPAQCHPLGNFTINHLAKVASAPGQLRVRYILDIAEIPSFQIMHAPGSADWNASTMQAWADRERSVVTAGFHVAIDGTPAQLLPLQAHATLRPGAGGLPIIRWIGTFVIPVSSGATHRVAIVDRVYADRRIGWKDIVAGAQVDPTDELQHYPSALIGSPRRINGVAFTLRSDGAIVNFSEQTDATPMSGTLTSWFAPTSLSDMFARPNQTPLFVVLTILAAFGLGALHAIEPGHGKALLAFTLVGSRATVKQALVLAASLTFAHTAGVLLLGFVLFFAAGFVSESIYPWITLISGIVIAFIGARSLARFVQMRRGLSHAHKHDHAHPHGHAHSHAIPGSRPLNFRTAILATMSGGIAPCPAAIVVLLAALRLHQVGYGTLLIVVFSMGLAALLSGLGIGVVHGASWLSRRSAYARFAPYGPLITAVVISAIGAWTLGAGLVQQGVSAPAPLLAAITLAAIAGYALAQHGHTHHDHTLPAAEANAI
ncbi:MAG TPA: hypothetical protein VGZ02_05340 [Candidatus Baltobacteraceae bacterium]|jgi:ABC-type nickel/cobalt efflux system permease component RcnA|nr:hypothetical protein [Candidatus Baltobacteraceae bacterium]